MREDAQLVCPLSYEDPDNKWELIQPILLEELPIRDVTWKSPISASYITIDSLPLRFLPSNAPLFKDTEHAFRWLLAPYVHFYILTSETMDAYKIAKTNVKKWIDARNNQKATPGKCPWFIIYLPLGTQSIEIYNKVYYRISNDFYVDRTGDHSVMLLLPTLIDESNPLNILSKKAASSFSLNLSSHHGNLITTTHMTDLLCLLREGIVRSFQQRCALYDSEIRRLDSARSTPAFDFRQLFLVKESLALMYQMMQLFDMALAQYEELEAILSYAQIGSLPDNEWPMVASEQVKMDMPLVPEASTQSVQALNAITGSGTAVGGGSGKDKEKDIMTDAVKNGDDIASYSINMARMKILKNKMTLLELHRYVYARQMYFLILLQRPIQCAQNSRTFLLFCYNFVLKKISLNNQYPSTEEGELSVEQLHYLRIQQLQMWALTAAIKVVRVCRDLISKMHSSDGNGFDNNAFAKQSIMTAVAQGKHKNSAPPPVAAPVVAASSEALSPTLSVSVGTTDTVTIDSTKAPLLLTSASTDAGTLDGKAHLLKESYVILAEILQFGVCRLNKLSPILFYARQQSLQGTSMQAGCLSFDGVADDKSEKAKEYFALFRQESSRQLMTQEFESMRADKPDNLSNVLVSLSQRVRSVSHYWAKIYSYAPVNFSDPDVWNTERDYLTQRTKVGFARIQMERGLVLECSLSLLLSEALWELYALADRVRFSYGAKIQMISMLVCSQQLPLAADCLEALFSSEHLYMHSGSDMIPKSLSLWAVHIYNNNLYISWEVMKRWLHHMHVNASRVSGGRRLQKAIAHMLIYVQLTNPSGQDANKAFKANYMNQLLSGESVGCPTEGRIEVSDVVIDRERNISLTMLPALPSLVLLPLNLFFRYSTSALPGCGTFQKGSIYVQDEKYPIRLLRFPTHATAQLQLSLQWLIDCPIKLDHILVVYRKINNIVFEHVHAFSNVFNQNNLFCDLNEMTMAHLLDLQDDEFACSVAPLDQTGVLYSLELLPLSLGEYFLERVVLVAGSAVFIDKPLASHIASITDQNVNSTSNSIHNTITNIQSASLDDYLPPVPVNHYELQSFLDAFPPIQFAMERNAQILDAHVYCPVLSGYDAPDCLVVTLRTKSFETINNININAIVQYQSVGAIGYNLLTEMMAKNGTMISGIAADGEMVFLEEDAASPKKLSNANRQSSSATPLDIPVAAVSVDIAQAVDWEIDVLRNDSAEEAEGGAEEGGAGEIPGNRLLQIKIPYTISLLGAPGIYDIPLEVGIKGSMNQSSAAIQYDILYTHSLRVSQLLSGMAMRYILHSGTQQNVCIDCCISNICPMTVFLLGYSLTVFRDGRWADISNDPSVTLLSSPYDLRCLADEEGDGTVCLAPGEDYSMNFIFSTAYDLQAAVLVHYIRDQGQIYAKGQAFSNGDVSTLRLLATAPVVMKEVEEQEEDEEMFESFENNLDLSMLASEEQMILNHNLYDQQVYQLVTRTNPLPVPYKEKEVQCKVHGLPAALTCALGVATCLTARLSISASLEVQYAITACKLLSSDQDPSKQELLDELLSVQSISLDGGLIAQVTLQDSKQYVPLGISVKQKEGAVDLQMGILPVQAGLCELPAIQVMVFRQHEDLPMYCHVFESAGHAEGSYGRMLVLPTLEDVFRKDVLRTHSRQMLCIKEEDVVAPV